MGYFRFSVQRLIEKKQALEKQLQEETRKDRIKQIESKIIELDKRIAPKMAWYSSMGTYRKENKTKEEENLENLTVSVLKEIAKEKGIKGYSKMTKEELIKEIENARA